MLNNLCIPVLLKGVALKRLTRFIIVGFLLVLVTGGEVMAQEKKGGVIRLEVTTIEGRVQKPNAFFINTRRSLVYESMEIKESFVKEIVKVVETGDF